MKVIKVILLTNNTVLISEIEEVGADVGEPDCKLINPYIITTSDQKITIQENVATLSPWMKRFSKETVFMISSDKILTHYRTNRHTSRKIPRKHKVTMALSKSVEDSLKEAESNLRNALAFAAQTRTSHGLWSDCRNYH